MPEAADDITYLYKSPIYTIGYHYFGFAHHKIYETARVLRIMAIAKKISLN